MNSITTLLIVTVCILTQAFFSGSEMVILSARRIRRRRNRQDGSKGAELALKMIENPK
jgi:CBS domain containing-hemolysin-like protein